MDDQNNLFGEWVVKVERNGSLTLPAEATQYLKQHAGERISLRLVPARLREELLERKVSDEEIEAISTRQFESRENVVRFLMAEGSLAGRKGFRRRAKGLMR